MIARTISSRVWKLLPAALAAMLALAAPSWGVVYTYGLHPDKERLVLEFAGQVPDYSLSRTGRLRLDMTLPSGMALDLDGADRVGLLDSRLVEDVRSVDGGVRIILKNPAFGFVSFVLKDKSKVVVDIFPDPLGARWKSSGTPGPAPKAAPGPAPQPAPRAVKPEPVPEPRAAKPEPAPVADSVAEPSPGSVAAPEISEPSPGTPLDSASDVDVLPSRRETSAYAAPYVFRGAVKQIGPGEARPMQPDIAPSGTPVLARAAEPAPAPEAAPEAAQTEPAEPEIKAVSPVPAPQAVPDPGVVLPGDTSIRVSKVPDKIGGRAALRASVTPPTDNDGDSSFRGLVTPPGEARAVRPPDDAQPPVDAAAVQPSDPMDLDMRAGQKIDEPVAGTEPATEAAPAPGDAFDDMDAVEDPDAPPAVNASEAARLAAKKAAEEERIKTYKSILFQAQTAINGGQYQAGRDQAEGLLRKKGLPDDLREDALYTLADVLYAMYTQDPAAHFAEISEAYEKAMNFNLDSYRVPAALLRRALLNLKVENIPEAQAFTDLLRRKYKGDENIPLSYFYWGEHYYRKKRFKEAAFQYQYLVQNFPESKHVREASVKLALSLRELGFDQQAFQIVDFIEKRWPRFYLDYPPLLRLLGDTALALGKRDKAKNHYWTYYNIDPQGDDADMVLARLGDIYSAEKRRHAAGELYTKAAADFPDREGGLISKMRLAEKGVYDKPTLEQMFSIFNQPFSLKPAEIYEEIVTKHADSALAPLAQLKLAIWHLFNHDYMEALDAVSAFEKGFPGNDLSDRAHEVGVKAFSRMVDKVMADQNYPRVLAMWRDYPYLKDNVDKLDPLTRLRLAQSFREKDFPDAALDLTAPILRQPQVKTASEGALSLTLGILVKRRAWNRVVDLAGLKDEWDLGPDHKRQMNFALALAYENLGRIEQSAPLWSSLANDLNLDNEQRAYAMYFMAQEAASRNRLKDAFDHAQDAYALFVETGSGDRGKIMDTVRILIDVNESTGRAGEALRWGLEYDKLIDSGDPSWPAFRYRLAGLYRKAANPKKWREILDSLSKAMPSSLYGRMAASDLQAHALEQAAREYAPPVQVQ